MRRILLLGVMQCAALGALTAPAVVAVSVLAQPMVGDDSTPDVYALIDSAAALTAMFAASLCGLLADRTMSRLGRRRPWLLGGSVVGLLDNADPRRPHRDRPYASPGSDHPVTITLKASHPMPCPPLARRNPCFSNASTTRPSPRPAT